MRRYKPTKRGTNYRQLWRIVDGAIRDTILTHPEFFPNQKRISAARLSLNKRVTGSVLGWAEQSAWGRSGESRRSDAEPSPDAVPQSDAGFLESGPFAHVECCDGLLNRALDEGRGGSLRPGQSPPDVEAA